MYYVSGFSNHFENKLSVFQDVIPYHSWTENDSAFMKWNNLVKLENLTINSTDTFPSIGTFLNSMGKKKTFIQTW